jgi:hypothetical protein
MRNMAAEARALNRIFQFAGLVFLFGLIGLAIGTEIYVLEYWGKDDSMFWILQGTWCVSVGIFISTIASIVKRQTLE